MTTDKLDAIVPCAELPGICAGIDDDAAGGGGIKIPTPRRPVPRPPQRNKKFSIFVKNQAR